jgi:hypothetical protein
MDRWFKVDADLLTKPKFMRVCEVTGLDHIEAAGCIVALWAWAHTHGCKVTVAPDRLEQRLGLRPGFLSGVQQVGWMEQDADGTHTIRFNGKTAEEIRAIKSQAGRIGNAVRWQVNRTGIAQASQSKNERESESENENEGASPDGDALQGAGSASTPAPARRSRRKVSDPIGWEADTGFTGIHPSLMAAWGEAAPACDITTELARASAWMLGQPVSKRKRDLRRFLTNWMLRAQERAASVGGGQQRSTGFATLPHGCWRDSDGTVRTPSGAALHPQGGGK